MSERASDQPFEFVVLGEHTGGELAPGTLPASDRWHRRAVRYMREAAWVVNDPLTFGEDVLDPSAGAVVPRGYLTDGDWIWPAAATYYLDKHGVAPPKEFFDLMFHRAFWPPDPWADRLGQAHQALLPRIPGPFEPPAPVQFRFPPDVYDLLVTSGWRPGRVIDVDVDLDVDPARAAILAEFGGLGFAVYGYARDFEVTGFNLLPAASPSDPGLIAAAEARIGGPLLPLGRADGWGELVLHPEHGIGSVGAVERFLGRDIEEALTNLVRGTLPPLEHRGGWSA